MQIIINGVGGQGVLFLSKIISETALEKNMKVLTSETIGMAQRGGSVISFLKIGDNYHSPMIIPKDADVLICLNENELENGLQYLKNSGKVFINSDKYFNATKIATEKGEPSMANIIFLGYICKDKDFPYNKEDFFKIIPDKSKTFFKLGYDYCQKS